MSDKGTTPDGIENSSQPIQAGHLSPKQISLTQGEDDSPTTANDEPQDMVDLHPDQDDALLQVGGRHRHSSSKSNKNMNTSAPRKFNKKAEKIKPKDGGGQGQPGGARPKSKPKNKDNNATPDTQSDANRIDLTKDHNIIPLFQDNTIDRPEGSKQTKPKDKTKQIPATKTRQQTNMEARYNFDSSEDENTNLGNLYKKQLQKTARDAAGRRRSHSADDKPSNNGLLTGWRHDNDSDHDQDHEDGMNSYYEKHVQNKPPPAPHRRIPGVKGSNNRKKQQEIIEQLANSDELEYCRDTGMARKKRSTRAESPVSDVRRVERRSPALRSPARSSRSRRSQKTRNSPRKRHRGYDRREPWERRRSPSEDTGETNSTNTDTNDEYTSASTDHTDNSLRSRDSRSSHDSRRRNKYKKNKKRSRCVKSGLHAKPSNKVKKELIYPHYSLCQGGGYVSAEITFNQLSYDQFIAGEVHTILRTKSSTEKRGRIRLLSTIARWKLRTNAVWSQIRSAYAVILRDIENGVNDWLGDFYPYQYILSEKPVPPTNNVNNSGKNVKRSTNAETYWFCKQYQRPEGCEERPPHVARIGNRDRIVAHYCAKCYIKDRTKRPHSESAIECPNKDT